MPFTDIEQAQATQMRNVTDMDYSVDTMETDSATGEGETKWTNEKWTQYLGYYKTIPELNAAIDAKSTWTVGKGFIADPETTGVLKGIIGWGKDTFNTILENAIRTAHIGGDAFIEIIKDGFGDLINMKPLDPSTIAIIINGQGMLTGYEQITTVGSPNKPFRVDQIFHLARNRVADECHGVSIIEKLENIILARNEAMANLKIVFQRYVKPFRIWELDSDKSSKITAFRKLIDQQNKDTENLIIPKGSVTVEHMGIPQFSTLNPLPYIEALNDYFYQAAGVPQIILGGAKDFTEASAKIAYLAFQQTIEEEQLFVEEQLLIQVGIELQLEFPATIENELISDKAKDGAVNMQPNDTETGQL